MLNLAVFFVLSGLACAEQYSSIGLDGRTLASAYPPLFYAGENGHNNDEGFTN